LFVANLPYKVNITPFRSGAHPCNAIFGEKINNLTASGALTYAEGYFVAPVNRDKKRAPAQPSGALSLKAPPRKERSFCNAEYTRD
jgi:hypothetical protein